jgi:hypothetical protein
MSGVEVGLEPIAPLIPDHIRAGMVGDLSFAL